MPQVPSLLFLHFKFSEVILLLYSSWLLATYFLEIYISILTSIIEISTCDLFLNNNILTQSIIFLPVFSKYVLSRKYIPYLKKTKEWFEYLHKHSILVTYFRKVKQTLTRIRKKTLEWKWLKKAWFPQRFNMPCWSLPTIYVAHMRNRNCEIMY